MKFPRFGGDLKEGLIQLFVGSASLQGFLFLLVDDGLSIFENGWHISLVVSLIYCLIPAAMVVVWHWFIRPRPSDVDSPGVKAMAIPWRVLLWSSSLLALGLTIHIISEFEEDLGVSTEKWSSIATFAAVLVIVVSVGYLLYLSLKNRFRSREIQDEEIAEKYSRAKKALNMEAIVIMIALAIGAVFVFSNTILDHSHSEDEQGNQITIQTESGKSVVINAKNEHEYNFRHSQMPNSVWDMPLRDSSLTTNDLIEMRREIDELQLELEAAKKFSKLVFSTIDIATEAESTDKPFKVPEALFTTPNHQGTELTAFSGLGNIYLREFGPNRGLTTEFLTEYKNAKLLIDELNQARSTFFISMLNNELPGDAKSMKGYNKAIENEITELELVKSIVESDLKYHLRDKIMIIQKDVAIVLCAYFLVALLLWYLFSSRSISRFARSGKETPASTKASEQAVYFKNMCMYLIILFLPLLKFDAEDTDVLDHPFWNITWSDVADAGKKKEPVEINGPLLTTVDVDLLMQQIKDQIGKGGLDDSTKNQLDRLETLLIRINATTGTIKTRVE